MKKLFTLLTLTLTMSVYAGAMSEIPLQLLELDNLGRLTFLKNVQRLRGLDSRNVKYSDLKSVVIGGDEEGSDYTGAYFGYQIKLSIVDENNTVRRFFCEQRLAVGSFEISLPRITRPAVCQEIN